MRTITVDTTTEQPEDRQACSELRQQLQAELLRLTRDLGRLETVLACAEGGSPEKRRACARAALLEVLEGHCRG